MSIFLIFGFLLIFALGTSTISMINAHPHATSTLMESHSHNVDSNLFQENFLVHTFENVAFSIHEFFNSLLFN